MVFLPVNIRIDGRKLLFVGGGSIAMHKIQTVERFTGDITVLAPEIDPRLEDKGFTLVWKAYEPSDLEDVVLVYAATGNDELNRRIRDDARARGILVNVVDSRELSDFISPAVLKQDDMTIAVSSDGRNARKSVEWRNRLQDLLDRGEL
ncbi:Precorrin-2 dehydrogenase [Prosthecochloris sp. CIB 2401]|uniref:precorrin-2 dehydrogenase n=2 Tax=Chlorobiaceae TaxID=191412 RepID=A0A5C4S2B6_PROVB|nr:Precorrin-2 dehydrogenase [Prosthecochloris sp. CIB 2401]TNJ37616.1 bifunctional precorrin-2 dehydrogenase/sirohydrochlorin ferrochelatase [Prosthecochloris vibrioformis]